MTGTARRSDVREASLNRRDAARSDAMNASRDLVTNNPPDLPPIDLDDANKVYNELSSEDPKDKMIKHIFSMMISSSAKLQQVDNNAKKIDNLEERIDALEAKVGGKDDIAVPRGLVIRNLPLPVQGKDELTQVRVVLDQVGVIDFDKDTDVIKAVRKRIC